MPATQTDRIDGLATSIAVKAPVHAITTANRSLSGLGSTSITFRSGISALTEGMRVLVLEQDDPVENGIYNVSTGDWQRARDFDGARDAARGTLVIFPASATSQALYFLKSSGSGSESSSGSHVIDTDSILFGLWANPNQTFPQVQPEIDELIVPVSTNYEPLRAERYGVVADGVTDSSDGLNDAITVASAYGEGGGTITLPPGVIRFESDVVLRDRVKLVGHGAGTILEFNGCSLTVDATAVPDPDAESRHLLSWGFDNIAVRRIGTAGPAVQFITTGGTGINDNRDVTRFCVYNLLIMESTGDGLVIEGAYIADFYHTIIHAAAGIGLAVNRQTTPGGGNVTGLNACGFHGIEVQGCGQAMDLNRCLGVTFTNAIVEGNTLGVEINTGTNINFFGGYFEGNSGYDFNVGPDASGAPTQLTIKGIVFFDAGGAKDYAIELIRATDLSVEDCSFQNYGIAGINRTNAATSTSVTGTHRGCSADGTTPAISDGDNASFHRAIDENILTETQTIDFASIAAGEQQAVNVACIGAEPTDFVLMSYGGSAADLQITASVSSNDNIRVIAQNNDTVAADAASRNFRFLVIKSFF